MDIKRVDVTISTDGACKNNNSKMPSPGGHAAKLRFGEHTKEVAGYSKQSTNNREELLGMIIGVQALKKPCNVTFRTDSHYLCTGLANVKKWCENGWKGKNGKMVKNIDLWQKLTELGKKGHHKFHFQHIPGHSGDPDNERCDFLAKEQIRLHEAR